MGTPLRLHTRSFKPSSPEPLSRINSHFNCECQRAPATPKRYSVQDASEAFAPIKSKHMGGSGPPNAFQVNAPGADVQERFPDRQQHYIVCQGRIRATAKSALLDHNDTEVALKTFGTSTLRNRYCGLWPKVPVPNSVHQGDLSIRFVWPHRGIIQEPHQRRAKGIRGQKLCFTLDP